MASWLLEAEMPDNAGLIWFGSEGGTFVAGSSDQQRYASLPSAYTPHSMTVRC